MKTYMTLAVAAVLTLAFGLAYADEIPIANKDAGTELYLSAFPIRGTAAEVKDFGVIGERIPAAAEVGTALYDSAFPKDTMLGSAEVRGSAAGGMAKDDENTVIWDNLLGAPGGSDLP